MIKNYLLLILTSSVIFSCSDPTKEIEFPKTYTFEDHLVKDSKLAIKTEEGYDKIPSQGYFQAFEELYDETDTLFDFFELRYSSIELIDETMGEILAEDFDGTIQTAPFNYTYENGEFTFDDPEASQLIDITTDQITLCQILSIKALFQELNGIYSLDGLFCNGDSLDEILEDQIALPNVFPNDTVGVYELNFIFR